MRPRSSQDGRRRSRVRASGAPRRHLGDWFNPDEILNGVQMWGRSRVGRRVLTIGCLVIAAAVAVIPLTRHVSTPATATDQPAPPAVHLQAPPTSVHRDNVANILPLPAIASAHRFGPALTTTTMRPPATTAAPATTVAPTAPPSATAHATTPPTAPPPPTTAPPETGITVPFTPTP